MAALTAAAEFPMGAAVACELPGAIVTGWALTTVAIVNGCVFATGPCGEAFDAASAFALSADWEDVEDVEDADDSVLAAALLFGAVPELSFCDAS